MEYDWMGVVDVKYTILMELVYGGALIVLSLWLILAIITTVILLAKSK